MREAVPEGQPRAFFGRRHSSYLLRCPCQFFTLLDSPGRWTIFLARLEIQWGSPYPGCKVQIRMKLDGFFERIGISVQLELLRMLGSSEQSYRYTFMSVEQFRDLTKVEQSRVYWYEMVERAHCASLTSLLRLQRWVALINSSAEGLNFVGFAASFRGVIESAADTRYA